MLFDLDNLRKNYGQFTALRGISLQTDAESVGLLGPNGAGKSTLIKVVLGLLPFSEGRVEVMGMKVPDQAADIRRVVGYMPESDCYLPYMKAIDYVSFNAELAGLPTKEAFRRAHEVLYFVGLEEARYRKLGGFSTGMKQRAKFAQAIVHGPRLLFLDEPTNGLDPQGREEMLSLIEDVRARGVRIVLSTHLLPDVERICDSVIMLNQGELIHTGAIADLQSGGDELLEVQTHLADDEFRGYLEEGGFEVFDADPGLKIRLDDKSSPRDILALAVEKDVQIRHFMPERLTLETAFLRLLDEARDASLER